MPWADRLSGSGGVSAYWGPHTDHVPSQVVQKYLFEPYNLNETTCDYGDKNPQLAVCLQTTAADYSKFLQSTLSASVLSQEIVTAYGLFNSFFLFFFLSDVNFVLIDRFLAISIEII